MPFAAGDTGLILVLPEVDAVVAPWRARLEPNAALGVPAHVTVLYPFVPAPELTSEVLEELDEAFADVPPFGLRLTRFERFPDDGVLFLAPEPAETCRRLTAIVQARWPEHRPYGGAHAEVVPHLTLAIGASRAEEALVEAALGPRLPLRARVEAVDLMAFDGAAWVGHSRFSLGRRGPADARG